jgi:hypothetical protein
VASERASTTDARGGLDLFLAVSRDSTSPGSLPKSPKR